MDTNIQVTCLLDRSWNPSSMEFEGTECDGTLIHISMGSSEDEAGELIPLGIVLLDDNTFQCVPMEFIRKKAI